MLVILCIAWRMTALVSMRRLFSVEKSLEFTLDIDKVRFVILRSKLTKDQSDPSQYQMLSLDLNL